MSRPKKSVDNQLVREHPSIEGVGASHPAILYMFRKGNKFVNQINSNMVSTQWEMPC